MLPDRLVYMANQIGRFFASQDADEARTVDAIATHLTKFWDPRMRREIVWKVQNGEAEALDPLPRRAVESLG